MKIGKELVVTVADFQFKLATAEQFEIVLDDGFDYFIGGNKPEFDCTISCHAGLDTKMIPTTTPIYTAKTNDAVLWQIYSDTNGILLTVNNPENTAELQQIARYNEAEKSLVVYSEAFEHDGKAVIESLKYPLLPLLLYYIALANDGLMIHASGVFDGEKGRIFSGFSGVGKSTMAKIWHDAGSSIINDDRMIIRKIEGDFWMYNTPMYYRDKPKKAPLHHVFLPFHNKENTLEKLTGVKAIASLMAFCIQHGYNATNTQKLLDLIGELTKKCPVNRLGVVPTPAIIDFIKNNES
jgi:hypothetical protein